MWRFRIPSPRGNLWIFNVPKTLQIPTWLDRILGQSARIGFWVLQVLHFGEEPDSIVSHL